MEENQPAVRAEDDKEDYRNTTFCHICQGEFKKKHDKKCKVLDHDHRTGKYKGAVHQDCNVNYLSPRFSPVIMHNFRGYDSHLFIKKAYELNQETHNKHISAIPNKYDKFMSVTLGKLKSIDSRQIMGSSLESLVTNI